MDYAAVLEVVRTWPQAEQYRLAAELCTDSEDIDAEREEMLAFLRESKAEIDAGYGVPALEFLDGLARKHNLKPPRS